MMVNKFIPSKNSEDHCQAQRIAFVHHKGGTGKTTACLNIAGWLTKLGQKVLVVDLDSQANATTGLGVDLKSIQYSMCDVLLDDISIKKIILETHSGINLAPATIDLLSAEISLAQESDSVNILKKKLENLDNLFNYILVDCPPGSTLLMMNGILATKNIIIPLDTGVFGFETLATLKTLILNLEEELGTEINVMMALLKVFSSSLIDKIFTNKIRNMITQYFLKNGLKNCSIYDIPFSTKICEAQMNGLPISHYASHSKVGKTYYQIAKDICSMNIV